MILLLLLNFIEYNKKKLHKIILKRIYVNMYIQYNIYLLEYSIRNLLLFRDCRIFVDQPKIRVFPKNRPQTTSAGVHCVKSSDMYISVI